MEPANKKKIFAILWVDDWSSFPLSKENIRWFHQNAGPLSLGIEMDERLPFPFSRQFKELKENNYDSSNDYLSHHYHPVRWKGKRFIKKIYDILQLRRYAYMIVRSLKIEELAHKVRRIIKHGQRSTALFLFLASALAVVIGISYLLFNLHWVASAAFLALAFIMAGLLFVVNYVHRSSHWDYLFSDWHFNKGFLQKLGENLNDHGISYPVVLRHGWCSPPASSMYFYMKVLGVLADASASPTPEDMKAGKGTRKLFWQHTQPYYANLAGDYDISWKGVDEEDRGMLELPANLGNIAEHGFGSFARERIEQTPDGGLVSTYIHGWEDFTPIKEWVKYLKKYYDVTFVRADWYTQQYMRKYPRPILIDRDFKAYWALQHDGSLHAMSEADHEIIRIKNLGRNDGHLNMLMEVNTEQPVPVISIQSPKVVVQDQQLKIEQNNEVNVIRQVKKGAYHLSLELQT